MIFYSGPQNTGLMHLDAEIRDFTFQRHIHTINKNQLHQQKEPGLFVALSKVAGLLSYDSVAKSRLNCI